MNDSVKNKINDFVVTGAKESVPVFGQIIDILVYNTDLVLLANPAVRDVQTPDHIHNTIGRYHFNKLPFGISSAPEHFQKQMSRILDGLGGVRCMMYDVLVFGQDQAEHNSRLLAVLPQN